MIETDFIRWSNKNEMNENYAYERTIHTIKSLIIPFVLTISFMLFGPLLSLIIDIGKLPLDHRSHFLLFWPKVSNKYILIIIISNKISIITNITQQQTVYCTDNGNFVTEMRICLK